MTRFLEEVAINAPAERVWDIVANTESTLPIWPGVHSVEYETGCRTLNANTIMKMQMDCIAGIGGLLVVKLVNVNHDDFCYESIIVKGPCGIKGSFGVAVETGKTRRDSFLTLSGEFDGNIIVRAASSALMPHIKTNLQNASRAIEKRLL